MPQLVFVALFHIFTVITHSTSVESQSSTKTSPSFVAEPLVSHGVIGSPRGLIQDDSGDILVVSRGTSEVYTIYQENNTVKSATIIQATDLRLNHGIAYSNGYIYASNSSSVFRWGYEPGQRSRITLEPEVVVKDIPRDGDHLTRTIIFDRYNHLYVTVGSASNVDVNSDRAQIRRFNLAEGYPSGGYTFQSGELFADGVRNTVGLGFDENNELWGVDCGADELYREDLGGDIHNSNPADKLIRFSRNGSYGYPFCWTVDQLAGHAQGKQMAWPTFMNDGIHTDAWCQNVKNNIPPTLPLPSHNAPLGLTFYDGKSCNSFPGSFPCSMKGDIFIAFHGSWNREPPAGYKVSRVVVDKKTGLPTGEILDIIYETDMNSCVYNPSTCFRPVDLVFDRHGHLIITSDTSSEVLRVKYKSSGSFADDEQKSLTLPIIVLVFVALLTGLILGMIIMRFCCSCCPEREIPYIKENI